MYLTLFFAFIFFSVIFDYFVIEFGVDIKELGHAIRWCIRASVAVILIYLDQSWPFWQLLATYGIAFWFLFDTGLNVLRNEKVWYLGSNFLDKLQKKYPNEFVWFVWKGIAFIGLVGAYYLN